ncbi:hypothetical protein [Aeromonas hydrophila]|uniref:hypothetical protein n=1 Tax=Aeromonas hydrophila TaxID=644 RepID=UPI000A6BCB00
MWACSADNGTAPSKRDAERRDFTVNALYYSAKDFTLHDFEGGLEDLAERKLELIGDPRPATAKIRCGCCAPCASPPSWT